MQATLWIIALWGAFITTHMTLSAPPLRATLAGAPAFVLVAAGYLNPSPAVTVVLRVFHADWFV